MPGLSWCLPIGRHKSSLRRDFCACWDADRGQKGDPVRRNPDITLAQKLLGGWTPQVPLERGLEATIAYFRGLNGRPQG